MPSNKLEYSTHTPAFLQRLKAGLSDDGRNNVKQIRPGKARLQTSTEDDEPVVVDEQGNVVGREEWEGMKKGEEGEKGKVDEEEGKGEGGDGDEVGERETQKVAGIGGVIKKRKGGRVVGGTEEVEGEVGKGLKRKGVVVGEAEAEAKAKATESTGAVAAAADEDKEKKRSETTKPKKKAKKIKLSFDDPE